MVSPSRALITGLSVIVAGLASAAYSSEPSDASKERLARHVRAALDDVDKRKEEMTAELRSMKSGRINKRLNKNADTIETRSGKRFLWKTVEIKQKAVEEMENRIDELDEVEAITPTLAFDDELSVGDIGRLPVSESQPATVIRGQLSFQGTKVTSYKYEVLQVIDQASALINWRKESLFFADRTGASDSQVFWLNGPTEGMTDGVRITLSGLYMVTGTKQYTTAAGGTKTVFALSKFDGDEIIERVKAERASKRPSPSTRAAYREWTDSTGAFTVEAKLIEVAGNDVVLEKKDGEQIRVPLLRMSEDDRSFLRQN